MDLICEWCGVEYLPRGGPSKYCSQRCNEAAWYRRKHPIQPDRRCEVCAASIDHRLRLAKYCGQNCAAVADYRRRHGTPVERSACALCEGPITIPARGPKPLYCSGACRSAAAYARYKDDGRVTAWAAKARQIRRGVYRAEGSERFAPQEIFERDGWACWLCGEQVDPSAPRFHPRSPSLDHLEPISHGGLHTRANVKCAHLRCNIVRGNRTRKKAA